jgi:hypothetical protein
MDTSPVFVLQNSLDLDVNLDSNLLPVTAIPANMEVNARHMEMDSCVHANLGSLDPYVKPISTNVQRIPA